MAELNTAWQAASQEMYAASGAAGAGGPQPGSDAGQGSGPSGGGTSDAQDVEYEEVKK